MAVPTAYMGLSLPTPSATLGPEWATDLNAAFALVDSHDHSPGHGVLVPSAGLNINADLPFNSQNATLLRSTRYVDNTAPLALPTDANAIYVSGGNLYFNSGAGLQVQITSGSALAASSLGGITGLAGSTASAAYSPSTQTFTWLQAPSTSALMDTGPLTIHDTAAGGPSGITLKSPPSIPNPYTITLPSALPTATGILTLSTTGAILAGGPLNANAQVISNLGAPSATTDAATKSYVDSSASLMSIQFANNVGFPVTSDALLYPFWVPTGNPAGTNPVGLGPLDQTDNAATTVFLIPLAGRLHTLVFRTPTAWSGGTGTIKVWVNGAALGTTLAISAGNLVSVDLNAAVAQGDRVAVTITAPTAASTTRNCIASIKYAPA